MHFTEIYDQTIQLWPSEISIEDGRDVAMDGGIFPSLNQHWSEIEIKTEHENEWTKLMVWAISCGLHKLACIKFSKGSKVIKVEDIDLPYVAYKFEEGLYLKENDSSYKDIRGQYKNDL